MLYEELFENVIIKGTLPVCTHEFKLLPETLASQVCRLMFRQINRTIYIFLGFFFILFRLILFVFN